MGGGGSGEAFDAVCPADFLARLSGCQMARDDVLAAEIAANPFGDVDASGDDGPLFVDDLHDASGRKLMNPKCFLEVFDLDSDDQNRAQSTGLILDSARHGTDPFVGG